MLLINSFSNINAQITKPIRTEESVENDIENFISTHLSTYKINFDRVKQLKEDQEKEQKEENSQFFSKSNFDNSLLEIKKYDLRKLYFENHPEDLKIFTSKLTSVNSALQTCADGDFENWPAANPFVFKHAIALNTGNTTGQSIVTTGSDFLPFSVGNTTNNFGSLATLVTSGVDPTIPAVSTVLSGNQAIKLNYPETSSSYTRDIVTMSRSFVVNQNNFDFNYSVILNDPGTGGSHPTINTKPYFLVRIYDSSQTNILRQVNVLANPNDCSFMSTTNTNLAGPILYSGWQCARVNLTEFIGQTVIIEFIVSDCIIGGHLGTVYIDNICNSNCANPLAGIINLNPIQTIFCPTVNQMICGTYQIPFNSIYSNMQLNILQNGVIVNSITTPSSLTTTTFCFTVPLSAFGTNPTGNFEFQVVGNFTRQCTINYQLDPISDNSANDTGPDVTFINPLIVPTFTQITPICKDIVAPTLPSISNNGITGTWSPSTITTSATGTFTYIFTPTSQCATITTMTISINPNLTPVFTQVPPICNGDILDLLSTTPSNFHYDLNGYWDPATMNNMNTTTYTYHPLPSPGQCVNSTTMTIVVKNLLALNDIFTGIPINSLTGGLTASVLTNDLYNVGSLQASGIDFAVSITNITATPSMSVIPALSFDSNGNITVPPGTPPGTYVITYQIISRICIPPISSSATATLIVNYVDIITPNITPGIRANNVVSLVDTQSGQIIIAGAFTAYNNVNCNGIARLKTDLTYESSFNVTGSTPNGFYPYAMKVIQNTGGNYNKILIGGGFTGWSGGTNGTGIARLNADGSIDYSFNSGALATPTSNRGITNQYATTFTAGTIYSIYVYPDSTSMAGKILIGGFFNTYNGYEANGLALLNADGSYDTSPSFNNNINSILDYLPEQSAKGFNNPVGAIIVQADGKIIIGGSFNWYNGLPKNGILRLNADGSMDNQYNILYTGTSPGFTSNSIGSGFSSISKKFVLQSQPDGKLIVGGNFLKYNGTPCNNIVRINTNGIFDSTFVMGTGFNNTTLNPNTGEPGIVRDLILDTTTSSNLLLYVAGDFTKYKGVACDEIIRIKCSGANSGIIDNSPLTGFNMTGHGPNGASNGTVWCMKRQLGDSKIIIGGKFTTYNTFSALNVTRIFPVTGSTTNEAKNGTIYYDSEPEIDLFAKDDVIIYPNPSTGIVNFKTNNFSEVSFSVFVYNVIGQKIFEKNDLTKEDTAIDLLGLKKGSYFVSFITENKTVTKTIIIK